MPSVGTQRIARELILAVSGLYVGNVDAWVIDRLTNMLVDQDVHSGERLFAEGEPPDSVYFIHNGEVRLERLGAPAWTYVGDWLVGAAEVFAERAHRRTATAMRPFHAMRMSATALLDLLEDSPALARASVMRSAQVVAALEEQVLVAPGAPADPRCWRPPTGRLGPMERLALFAGVRMLRGAGVQVLAELSTAAEELVFAAGDVVLERGEDRTHALVVADGEIKADFRHGTVLRRYHTGDVVAGASAFGDHAREWRALATSPSRAVRFPIETWFEAMEEHFDLTRSALMSLSLRRELLLDHMETEGSSIILH